MTDTPICLAPFSSIVIDTTKKVFPCSAFDNRLDGFGNIKTENISTIVNNNNWNILREDLADGKIHKGCEGCNQRGKDTGWTLKDMYQDNAQGYKLGGWEDGRIRLLELSGSNVCNLACLHCSNTFSSAWADDYFRLGYDWNVDTTYGDPELLLENLSRLDLTAVNRIEFKGGEPLLNPETVASLEYLKNKDLLKNIDVIINTNATVVDDKLLELLAHAKFVQILVSVDGPDKLNQYIRYGRETVASFENIERTIKKYNSLPRVKIGIACAVMVYNIFRLAEIRDWWNELKSTHQNMEPLRDFHLIVTNPEHLNIRVLTTITIQL
jgi:radical SAM protein with 4Fe4S-binding SPASM domain